MAPRPRQPARHRRRDRRADRRGGGRRRSWGHALGHPADHEARTDQQHPHTAAVQRVGQAAREGVEAGLGGAVDEVGPARAHRGHRGQDHDQPAPLGAQVRDGREQGGDVAGQVGLDQPPGGDRVGVQLRLRGEQSGGGDHQVDRPGGEQVVHQALVGVERGGVVGHGADPVRQGGAQLGHPLLVAPGQDHLAAGRRVKRLEDLVADLAGAAQQQDPARRPAVRWLARLDRLARLSSLAQLGGLARLLQGHSPSLRPRSDRMVSAGSRRARAARQSSSGRYIASKAARPRRASLAR